MERQQSGYDNPGSGKEENKGATYFKKPKQIMTGLNNV